MEPQSPAEPSCHVRIQVCISQRPISSRKLIWGAAELLFWELGLRFRAPKSPQTRLCSLQSHAKGSEQTLTPVLVLREAGNPPGQAWSLALLALSCNWAISPNQQGLLFIHWPLAKCSNFYSAFYFYCFYISFFCQLKKKKNRIILFISYPQCECPDCLSLSLQGRKFYRFAKYLNIAASNSWFDRRGEGEKNFLFPFKLLLVQTEIPFKPEGLDWGLRIKENRTDRKCGFSLELDLKRVTSDSGLFFSLLHPLQNGLIFAISPAKGLNCINMCMCLQPFFVCFALYDNCM